MLCTACQSLSPELRRHPRGPVHPSAWPSALRGLVCERCGAAVRAGPPPPDPLRGLERLGLGSAGPLLCDHPPRAA